MSAAATLHRLTRHGSSLGASDREQLVAFRPLDPHNRPQPFKRYGGRELVPLPRALALSSVPSADVLSGASRGVAGPWNEERLARLLFLSNGVSRASRSAYGATTYFRTAMSAGNLHPIEIYVVSGDLDGFPAGIRHFAPLEFGLTELRAGDFRKALAVAAADLRVADAPVTLVVTGIPWRTTWKYGERGFRHLYWDAGTMLGNLLALEPCASVRVGFADEPVSQLVGVDGVSEFPLVLVVLDGLEAGEHREATASTEAVEALDLAVETISPAPIEFPLVTAEQRDGDLADTTAVRQWRMSADSLAIPTPGEVTPATNASDDPIETVILRRGSTRLMRRETVRGELLTWGLSVAARAVPGDASCEGASLLQHFVSVHDVENVVAGSYRLHGGQLEPGRTGQHRDVAAHLCYDQPLGGDSAYTVFHTADLDEVLGALGSRGYRAAQLEAGIAAGRLALAAFALGYGATGLTFYDDAVSQHFATRAACMLVTAVGVPDYRNAPGGPPTSPTELARFDQLMERLSIRLHRGDF